jgi:hypothetical protein
MKETAPSDGLVRVSDLVIGHPEVRSFAELKGLVAGVARSGYRFLEFDVKPDYVDTPRDWDRVLENVFYWGEGAGR